jgi:hypothetical protein
MNTLEFLNQFVNIVCHKIHHNLDEFDSIATRKDVLLIKATTFYYIYKHNVFGDERLSMREFFRVCGQYLYYDKYVCTHGTEYFYYVVFNKDHPMYQLTADIITKRVEADGPELLTDLLRIVRAVTKE